MPALQRLSNRLVGWAGRIGPHVLRVGLGIVFVWFGALKLVPGLSPAEALVERTVSWAVDPAWFMPVLAAWEMLIGVGLVTNRLRRTTLALLFAHMAGTFLPLVVCPELVWTHFPYAWTLEGQYILKNLVIVGAGLTLLARVEVGVPRATVVRRPVGVRRSRARLAG